MAQVEAPAAKSNSEQLAFGLDRLRWGMSPAEARAAYPDLSATTSDPTVFGIMNLEALYLDKYVYAGCVFHGVLYFDGGHLRIVSFAQMEPPCLNQPCATRMESEFSAQYGTPVEYHERTASIDVAGQWFPSKGYYGRYKGPNNRANYERTPRIDFSFADAANPPARIEFY